MNHPGTHDMAWGLDELRRLAAGASNRRTETGIPRVAMVQGAVAEHQLNAVYEPMLNLVLRGSKTMTIGDRVLHYDAATYFVMSVEVPAVGVVRPGADGAPYLAVSLTLDATRLAALLSDLPAPPDPEGAEAGFEVAAVTSELVDAWVRMLRLMHHPDDIDALAPVYEREILYRVLQGPQGRLLRALGRPDSALARIRASIERIRREHDQPLRVPELADRAAMSVSAFHRQFKAATAQSPLQYQKRIRLLRARSLLLAGSHGVAAAAYAVGYESASQFSREYARAFGLSPARDLARFAARAGAANEP